MKAKVALKEGFRYHRLDNSYVDVKVGEIIETEDIPPFERSERLRDGHLTPIKEKPAPAEKPASDPPDTPKEPKK